MASDFELADGDDGFAGFKDKMTHVFCSYLIQREVSRHSSTATRWPLRMGWVATRSVHSARGKIEASIAFATGQMGAGVVV